ncbi:LysR family transcriptional regulator [Salinifilum aidingensis]
MPDLESLQMLVQVSSCGSLTAAAREGGISQPAVSKRIGLLERRLGVRLLDRSQRGSTLTEAGELVTGWAQRVLDELKVLTDGAEALRRESAAHLTIAASMTVAEHLLPIWLGELRRADPELHVGLQVTNSAEVCDLVRAKSVDLGFIESPGGLGGLRHRAVAKDRLVLVVAPDHPWGRRRRPVTVGELARTPLISREEGSGTRDTAERAISASGERLVPPLLELGSSAAIRSTVISGGGPALISRLVVANDIANRALVEVPTTGMDLGRTMRVVWHAEHPPGPPAEMLLAHAARKRSARG